MKENQTILPRTLPVTHAVLFNTGSDENLLVSMENGFGRLFAGKLPLNIRRLGNVDSLVRAYHDAILSVTDPDALIILAHQDAEPFFPDALNGLNANLPSGHWFAETMRKPHLWFDRTMGLFSLPDTGILGAAGAKGIFPETAWWQYPDLSGAVVVSSEGQSLKVNLYGEYGRVAVLDGFLLMLKRKAYNVMGVPPMELKGFHYYDMDLCLRAHIAGLKNYTIPILMKHLSHGARSDNPQWIADKQIFNRIYAKYLPLIIK